MVVNGREEFNVGVFENEIIDIVYYLGIIKCYVFWIVLLVIVFMILVVLLVMCMMFMFIFIIIILVEVEKVNVVLIEEVYGFDIKWKDYM